MSTLDRTGLHTPSPIYGLPQGFSIADLGKTGALPVVMLTAITVATTSAAFNLGARAIQLLVSFANATTTFDLLVYTAADNYTTPVATFTGLTVGKVDGLYVGGFDQHISLDGQQVKVRAQNFSGTVGAVTVSAYVNS